MATFHYKGVGRDGTKLSGEIDADSVAAARRKLHTDGVFPLELDEKKPSRSFFSGAGLLSRQDILPLATRQIATLIDAGVPIVKALQSLCGQVEDPGFRGVLIDIQEAVRAGMPFARAIETHPAVFPEIYVSMVRAGEESGHLPLALSRLADHLELQARTRSRVRSALAYPILMGVVGVLVVSFLLTFVVPKIVGIFSHLGAALPLPTKMLLAVTGVLSSAWWAILIVIFLAVAVFRRYVATPPGRLVRDGLLLRLPLFGRINHLAALSRFSRTLSTLIAGGIPVDRALRIVAPVVGNAVMSTHIESAATRVVEGFSLSEALKTFGEIPETLIQMVSVGEESGKLDFILEKMSDSLDGELDARMTRLLSLLEPAIILAMGLTVGFIVIAILLPLLEISNIVR
ncbi:MAG TPA: type II secretion system F family protein [Candidatus Deferrimicrobiaceae bacterium]